VVYNNKHIKATLTLKTKSPTTWIVMKGKNFSKLSRTKLDLENWNGKLKERIKDTVNTELHNCSVK
jgi:hypothetical protein